MNLPNIISVKMEATDQHYQTRNWKKHNVEGVGHAGSTSGDSSLELRLGTEEFKVIIKHLWQVHEQEFEKYYKKPDSHPKYYQEWPAFIQKRTQKILEFGVDPKTYNFESEWKLFWDIRLQELKVEEWNLRKKKYLFLCSSNSRAYRPRSGHSSGSSRSPSSLSQSSVSSRTRTSERKQNHHRKSDSKRRKWRRRSRITTNTLSASESSDRSGSAGSRSHDRSRSRSQGRNRSRSRRRRRSGNSSRSWSKNSSRCKDRCSSVNKVRSKNRSRSRSCSRFRDKDRTKSKSRSRSNSRSVSRFTDISRSRSRNSSSSKNRSRSRSENRSRSRSENRSRSKTRSRSKRRFGSRDRSKKKFRPMSRSRSNSKKEFRNRSRSKKRLNSRSSGRSRSKNRSRSRSRKRYRSRSKSRNKFRSRSRYMSASRSRSRSGSGPRYNWFNFSYSIPPVPAKTVKSELEQDVKKEIKSEFPEAKTESLEHPVRSSKCSRTGDVEDKKKKKNPLRKTSENCSNSVTARQIKNTAKSIKKEKPDDEKADKKRKSSHKVRKEEKTQTTKSKKDDLKKTGSRSKKRKKSRSRERSHKYEKKDSTSKKVIGKTKHSDASSTQTSSKKLLDPKHHKPDAKTECLQGLNNVNSPQKLSSLKGKQGPNQNLSSDFPQTTSSRSPSKGTCASKPALTKTPLSVELNTFKETNDKPTVPVEPVSKNLSDWDLLDIVSKKHYSNNSNVVPHQSACKDLSGDSSVLEQTSGILPPHKNESSEILVLKHKKGKKSFPVISIVSGSEDEGTEQKDGTRNKRLVGADVKNKCPSRDTGPVQTSSNKNGKGKTSSNIVSGKLKGSSPVYSKRQKDPLDKLKPREPLVLNDLKSTGNVDSIFDCKSQADMECTTIELNIKKPKLQFDVRRAPGKKNEDDQNSKFVIDYKMDEDVDKNSNATEQIIPQAKPVCLNSGSMQMERSKSSRSVAQNYGSDNTGERLKSKLENPVDSKDNSRSLLGKRSQSCSSDNSLENHMSILDKGIEPSCLSPESKIQNSKSTLGEKSVRLNVDDCVVRTIKAHSKERSEGEEVPRDCGQEPTLLNSSFDSCRSEGTQISGSSSERMVLDISGESCIIPDGVQVPGSSSLLAEVKCNVVSTLKHMYDLRDALGSLASQVCWIYQEADKREKSGEDLSEFIKDADTRRVLKMVYNKIKDSLDAENVGVMQKAVRMELLRQVKEVLKAGRPPVDETYGLDLPKLARCCLNYSREEIIDLIMKTLVYKGKYEPTPTIVTNLYSRILDEQLKLV